MQLALNKLSGKFIFGDFTKIANFLYFNKISGKFIVGSIDLKDAWIIPISGNPTNPETPTNGTIVFSATEDLTAESTGDVVIVSTTRADDDVYRSHTVVVSCPNGGSGSIVVSDAHKVVSLCNHNGSSDPNINFYGGTDATAPQLSWNLNDIPINIEKIRQFNTTSNIIIGSGTKRLPIKLSYIFVFAGAAIWTINKIGNPSEPKPNMTTLRLSRFRNGSNDINYTDLISLLISIINDVGTIVNNIDIREQIPANVTAIQSANPNEFGTLAEQARFYIEEIKKPELSGGKGVSISINTIII